MSPRRAVACLLLVFAASRLLYETVSPGVGFVSLSGPVAQRVADAVAGRNFELDTLERGMPLVDEKLLREDLARSLAHLHAQPPLFNLMVAGVLRSTGDAARAFQWIGWALGLALLLLTLDLARRLGVPTGTALVVTLTFALNPNAMWMESAVYYGTVMALLLTLAGYAFHRALAERSTGWFAVLCVALALLPLTRAFFTWFWCVAAAVACTVAFLRVAPGRRAAVIALAAVPCVASVGFQARQYAKFGLVSGSSWFGCNLTTMTAGMSGEKQAALAAGRVSPLVNVYRNASPDVYKKYLPVPVTGVPVLDQEWKSGGEPNFHNLVYVQVGRQYLADSLYVIVRAPHKYAFNVLNSVYIFSGYQIGMYWHEPRKFFSTWSPLDIVAPFAGFPLLVAAVGYGLWHLRRSGELVDRASVAFLTLNFLYVALVSCLFEKSEGPLYRYQADAFLATLLGLAWTAWRARSRAALDEAA
jgi:hypothetical protein